MTLLPNTHPTLSSCYHPSTSWHTVVARNLAAEPAFQGSLHHFSLSLSLTIYASPYPVS